MQEHRRRLTLYLYTGTSDFGRAIRPAFATRDTPYVQPLRTKPQPRFVARWRVGDPPLSGLTYSDTSDDGEDDGDDLSLYDFVWADPMPGPSDFRALMRAAVAALDNFIGNLNAEFE